MSQSSVVADHHMRVDLISSRPKQILIVVANPSTSTTLGWPVAFSGAELTHPYYELTERGVELFAGKTVTGFFDGRLITGQQQYSGRRVAHMVIEAMGV